MNANVASILAVVFYISVWTWTPRSSVLSGWIRNSRYYSLFILTYVSVVPGAIPEFVSLFTPQIVVGGVVLIVVIKEISNRRLSLIVIGAICLYFLFSLIGHSEITIETRIAFIQGLGITAMCIVLTRTLEARGFRILLIPISILAVMSIGVAEVIVPRSDSDPSNALSIMVRFVEGFSFEVTKLVIIWFLLDLWQPNKQTNNVSLWQRIKFLGFWTLPFLMCLPAIFGIIVVTHYDQNLSNEFGENTAMMLALSVAAILFGIFQKHSNWPEQKKRNSMGIVCLALLIISILNLPGLSETENLFLMNISGAMFISVTIDILFITPNGRRPGILLPLVTILLFVVQIGSGMNVDVTWQSLALNVILEIVTVVIYVYFLESRTLKTV